MKACSFSRWSVEVPRWTARLLATLVVGIACFFLVGTGGFNPSKLTMVETVQMTLFLTAFGGMVAAWRWELVGGAIATCAMGLFILVELAASGRFPKGPVLYFMLLPGIFFMLSGILSARTSAWGERT